MSDSEVLGFFFFPFFPFSSVSKKTSYNRFFKNLCEAHWFLALCISISRVTRCSLWICVLGIPSEQRCPTFPSLSLQSTLEVPIQVFKPANKEEKVTLDDRRRDLWLVPPSIFFLPPALDDAGFDALPDSLCLNNDSFCLHQWTNARET